MSTIQKTASTPKKGAASKKINFDALLGAIKENLLNKKAIRAASREYGVDRITLSRHAKKVADHFTDISTVSDVDLLEFIRASNMHIPSNMVCFFIVFVNCSFVPNVNGIFMYFS